MTRVIDVAAGVFADSRGRILVAERPAGKSMAGYWEFPGGKRQLGETALQALIRELREELGVEARVARHLIRYSHRYPDVEVRLFVWRVLAWAGEPQSAEGQALQWLAPEALLERGLLPADSAIVEALLADTPVMNLPLELCLAS